MKQSSRQNKARYLQNLVKDKICKTFNLNNKDISVLKGDEFSKGNCQGIDHDGNLLLQFPNGSKKSFNSGEIDLLL